MVVDAWPVKKTSVPDVKTIHVPTMCRSMKLQELSFKENNWRVDQSRTIILEFSKIQ